jgi:16S rRNA (cytosine1402-N4)-methyltransferase
MTDARPHEPVLEEAVLDRLAPGPGDVMVDLTVGAGGHAARILERVGPTGRVIGVDRDVAALTVAREVLAPFGERVVVRQGRSDALRVILGELGIEEVQGVLLDLGVSSMQLDDPKRGFSFRHDGPLDMRMNRSDGVSARDFLIEASVEEIERVLREYGEERSARRLAVRLKELFNARPPRTTLELANFIASLHPAQAKGRARIHPATRTFQALRMAVNDELGILRRTLPLAFSALAPGGRLAVIAFHSLEDRVVKQFFAEGSREGHWTDVTRKPLRPTDAEIARNPRSRSARLRAAVKAGGSEDIVP